MKGIITLCGSTKFKQEFNDANFWLTMNDYIVLSVGSFLHSDSDPEIKDIILEHKQQLDKLHKAKIDRSFAIMVIDVNNYIGESTTSEIEHALNNRKNIYSYSLSKAENPQLKQLVELAPVSVFAWIEQRKAHFKQSKAN